MAAPNIVNVTTINGKSAVADLGTTLTTTLLTAASDRDWETIAAAIAFPIDIPLTSAKDNCPTAVVPDPVILSTLKNLLAVTFPVGNLSS